MNNLDEIRKLTEPMCHYGQMVSDFVEYLPICIHEIDLNGKVSSMNPAGIKMIGKKSEEEVIGTDYFSFVSKQDKARIKRYWQRAVKFGVSTKFRFISTTGAVFTSCFTPVFGPNGRVQKVIGFTNDIADYES